MCRVQTRAKKNEVIIALRLNNSINLYRDELFHYPPISSVLENNSGTNFLSCQNSECITTRKHLHTFAENNQPSTSAKETANKQARKRKTEGPTRQKCGVNIKDRQGRYPIKSVLQKHTLQAEEMENEL